MIEKVSLQNTTDTQFVCRVLTIYIYLPKSTCTKSSSHHAYGLGHFRIFPRAVSKTVRPINLASVRYHWSRRQPSCSGSNRS